MGMDLLSQLDETVQFLRARYSNKPSVGIVLGSGMGNFTDEIVIEKEIDYADIPNFPLSTVEGHKGKLVFGKLSNKTVMVMAGRFHFYEGYTAQEIVFPIRVMKWLGVEILILSNAAGAVNPSFNVGDLMIIKDHISLFTPNPLIGKNFEELGPRFPDMSEPYKRSLIQQVKAIAEKNGIKLKEGVYVSVTGPTFETTAEYNLISVIGADAVGMSTVQECIAAHHMGMSVFAVSIITDLAVREENNMITHEEVLRAALETEPKLALLLRELVGAL
jgi:purine-nucleoside phosphorylase